MQNKWRSFLLCIAEVPRNLGEINIKANRAKYKCLWFFEGEAHIEALELYENQGEVLPGHRLNVTYTPP